jgi:hypothetical protein
LQEIIPMSESVYMVAYADNEAARVCLELSKDRHAFEKEVEKALSLSPGTIKFARLRAFFWEVGTHYSVDGVAPNLHPAKGLFIVGEAVAKHKGWVEGALETVHAALGV